MIIQCDIIFSYGDHIEESLLITCVNLSEDYMVCPTSGRTSVQLSEFYDHFKSLKYAILYDIEKQYFGT